MERFRDFVHVRYAAGRQPVGQLKVVEARSADQDAYTLLFQLAKIFDRLRAFFGQLYSAVVQDQRLRLAV